jgi:hypothetical protein
MVPNISNYSKGYTLYFSLKITKIGLNFPILPAEEEVEDLLGLGGRRLPRSPVKYS